MRRRVGLHALVLALFLLLLGTSVSAAPQPGHVHFTAAGDFGTSSNAMAVLNTIDATDSDFTLALGDLSYGVTGQEQAWCDSVTSRVGAGYPFEVVSGNHEGNGQNGNINDFTPCLPNQLPGAVGTYGRQYYVDVPAENPIARFIMISPNIQFPDSTWAYTAGSTRYTWTANAIDGARNASIPWVVVGMHKPCLSVGDYGCEPGPDLYNMLLSKKVDLILSGHDHVYQRTHQLGLRTGCTTLSPGTFNSSCVIDSDSTFTQGAGSVAMTVATGGQGLYDVNAADSETNYFAATAGLNKNGTFGVLDVDATDDTLQASFVRAAGGTFTDSFTISRNTSPNVPPVASFTSSCSNLTCSFNAGASTDSDGSIAGYAWEFGDGTTATGVTPSRTYSAAGSFSVRLTVTDNSGGTGEDTKNVITTAPPASSYVSDQFSRTVSNGLGAAPTGGNWTLGGTASNYSVGGGKGAIRMAAGGGGAAYLNSVSAPASDLRLVVGIDKLPVAGSMYFTTQGRRITGQGGYASLIRFAPVTGTNPSAISLELIRLSSTNAETSIQGSTTIAGLSYAVGDTLNLRMQVVGSSPSTIRAKVWKVGTPEPATWQRSATDTTTGLQGSGSVALSPFLSGATSNSPIMIQLDELTVTAP